ncbi:MAG: NAD(P)H-dependent oxidoreductase [Candidatus Omnitrophica bacterium]|nr:NAD(P)H-dependent oxidoreductase [Candidatus Omnitrophota bacterium]
MKVAIIYYSFSGNTKMVAHYLKEYLKETSEVEMIELRSLDESNNFFVQAARAFKGARARIQNAQLDLSGFDFVCFGTPVWAFGPAPAMNTYLDNCTGLQSKKVILFTTYGSGTGNERCLNRMQEVLAKKGAAYFKRFSIQQGKVGEREFIFSLLREKIIS